MNEQTISNIDRLDLVRRRRLATARVERETLRNEVLATLIETNRRACELRTWIEQAAPKVAVLQDARLARMLDWARAELASLEAAGDLKRLSETLRAGDLFPQADSLTDPLGDPPPAHPWGW